MVSLIYGKGKGWSFSKKDFSHLGELANIDRALSRMAEKGTIRRVMRGLYDYPSYSKLLKKDLSPDINQVAHALARKFGWTIQVSGNAALNLVSLSTQIPTQYLYLSDGPSKSYQLESTEVTFKKTRFTQLGLKYSYNEILVQAVQALGDRELTNGELQKLRAYLLKASRVKVDKESEGSGSVLPQLLVDRTLKDTQFVTSWIARNIRQVLLAVNNKTVTYKTDSSDQPPLTEQEKAGLESLAGLSDDEIDTSDIAPLDENFWKVAEQSAFYKPVKKQITVRVDADVLAWLKSQDGSYETRMNDILRQAMIKIAG